MPIRLVAIIAATLMLVGCMSAPSTSITTVETPPPAAIATSTATISLPPEPTASPTMTVVPPTPVPPTAMPVPPTATRVPPTSAPTDAPTPTIAGSSPAAVQRTGRLAGLRICLDPGHDATYVPGTVARDAQGNVLIKEQDMTLAVVHKLKGMLEAEGAAVCVTRNESGVLRIQPYDYNGNGTTRMAYDSPEWTQPRIDYTNGFGADMLLSIHFNGFGDASVSGAEVYYSDSGENASNNWSFGQSVLDALLAEITVNGYRPVNRGLRVDRYKTEYRNYVGYYGYDQSCSDCLRLLILGNNPMSLHAGTWRAGALVEALFFTNPSDIAFLIRPDAVDIIAQGLAHGVLRYAGG